MRFERLKIAALLMLATSAALPLASAQAVSASVAAATASEVLAPGERLTANAYRQSPNGLYRLVQYADGNLVVVDTATKKPLWNAQTHGNPGAYTHLQTDGNVVVKSAEGTALWSTKTHGNPQARLVVQNDSNLVLYSGTKALWSSRRSTSVLAPGERLTANAYRQSPNGLYRLVQYADGNLVVVDTATKKPCGARRRMVTPRRTRSCRRTGTSW
ncbi:hypothetical protein ACFQ0B_77285 [Nonomuraea thailandensis]